MKKVFAVLLLLVMALTLTSMQTTRADSNRCSECGRVYGWGNILRQTSACVILSGLEQQN